jgi:hypothetical protein
LFVIFKKMVDTHLNVQKRNVTRRKSETARGLGKMALFARFLRQTQISILEILHIFLWLKFSPSLNSNKNYLFSKVSALYGKVCGFMIPDRSFLWWGG